MASESDSANASSTEALSLAFGATTALLQDVHDELARRFYLDDDHRRLFHEALVHFAAVSVRSMNAANALVQLGWVPECAPLIRPLYEAARDVAFLLSTSGAKRRDVAGRFQAARVLRAPDPPGYSYRDTQFEEQLRREFPGRSWEPNSHWSGDPIKEVADTATVYLRSVVGDFDQRLAKRLLFGFPSVVGHPDPGGWSLYPIDERTCRVLLEPGGQCPRIWLVIGVRSGALLALVLARRLATDDQRNEVLRRAEGIMGS